MNLIGRADTRVGLWIAALVVVAGFVWGWPRGVADMTFGQVAAGEGDAPAAADDAVLDGAKAAAEEEDAAEQMGATAGPRLRGDEPLAKMVLDSGVFGWIFYGVLAIFSIAGMAVGLERLVRLRRGKILPATFVAGLRNLARENKDTADNFRTLCDATPAPIARILRAGLSRAGRPFAEVEKSMEDAAFREMAELRQRVEPLDVIGSVAPLVGLLGTVVGMIFAFKISSQAGLGRAELLAEGIYLALMTTAGGLTIAIPCLLLHAWFNSRTEKYLREIAETLQETVPCFTRMENQAVSNDLLRNASRASAEPATAASEPVAATPVG